MPRKSPTKEETLLKTIKKLETRFHRSLNDVHIWCSVAIEALCNVEKDEEFIQNNIFSVPSSLERGEFRTVKRKPEEVAHIIQNALDYELYFSVFVLLVAQVEAYLFEVVAAVLRFDNRRLLTTVQGMDSIKKVDLSDIVNCGSKEAIIESIVNQQIGALFYAKPSVQFTYLRQALGIDIEESLKNDWIEYKATRDLIVHNSGVINNIYIEKNGESARGQIGEKIIVDQVYFDQAVGRMKQLVHEVANRINASIAENN
jgi:hypothetical protein